MTARRCRTTRAIWRSRLQVCFTTGWRWCAKITTGPGGVSIFIEKHIPVAAGLGGGSSNAGRTLLHLNQYHGWPFSAAEISHMGLAIGADVPFFLQEKPAVATGIGECLEIYRGLPVLPIVVACPDISVSTAAVYKKLNLGLTKCGKKLKKFFSNKSTFDVKHDLCNDLETVAIPEYPVISDIKRELLQHGGPCRIDVRQWSGGLWNLFGFTQSQACV